MTIIAPGNAPEAWLTCHWSIKRCNTSSGLISSFLFRFLISLISTVKSIFLIPAVDWIFSTIQASLFCQPKLSYKQNKTKQNKQKQKKKNTGLLWNTTAIRFTDKTLKHHKSILFSGVNLMTCRFRLTYRLIRLSWTMANFLKANSLFLYFHIRVYFYN